MLNADAKQLEWVGAAYLSQDPVAMEEIYNAIDQHTDNQGRFKLPSRLIAKTFLFRIIYGGSAGGFSNDPDFGSIGGKSFWQRAIDAFYNKYQGIYAWHERLVESAIQSGKITIPTGREYLYPSEEVIRNIKYWRPKILNYPVQGLGADMMMLARTSLYRRLKESNNKSLLINSVHDSILLDVPNVNSIDSDPNSWYNVGKLVKRVFDDVPENFERLFKQKFNLPFRVELQVGPNWKEMEELIYED